MDWPLQGPGRDHVLARIDRFDQATASRIKSDDHYNPYHGVPALLDLESKLGVKSTFFFRPKFDDGQLVTPYQDEIRELTNKGWEVGLHINDAGSLSSVIDEKEFLEKIAGTKIYGTRAHYLRIKKEQVPFLHRAGVAYDSSLCYSQDSFDLRNTGFVIEEDGLAVFPITFMDAYLFTYTRLTEQNVVSYVKTNIQKAKNSGASMVTILWHDNAILMKGGRMYGKLLEGLVAMRGLTFVRGIDAYEHVTSGFAERSI